MTSGSSNPPPSEPVLEQWVSATWLVRRTPLPGDIAQLFKVADRNLRDAASPQLSTDGQFIFAYSAGLACAHAALIASGYDATKGYSHHLRIIRSVQHTLGYDIGTIDMFDQMRTKRHEGTYEQVGVVSQRETEAMLQLAKRLRTDVHEWIRRTHPELLKAK